MDKAKPIKVPETVVLELQRQVHWYRNAYAAKLDALRVAEAKLDQAAKEADQAFTELKEMCEYLDEVSPDTHDGSWMEELGVDFMEAIKDGRAT